MLKNHLKIAFRSFWKNKLNSFINLVGLSFGLAACTLIAMYVSHEKSYDRFHEDSDRILNLKSYFEMNGNRIGMSRFSAIVASELKDKSPHIEDAFRYFTSQDPISIKTSKASTEIFYNKNLLDA
ncbi:MAG: ABC transporter permease, partial [Bacteroidota bacterium]